MEYKNISLPEIYKESPDFRLFCTWFETALEKVKYDTENLFDLYDPLRCPSDLLWLLADTMGFKLDDRLPDSFNRLVLIYFMSMIYNRGSRDGVTLAAEVNLAQFGIQQKANGYTDENGNTVEPNPILNERLEDTSIPVNSAFVTPHTKDGYIDVVYFSTKLPLDACIEYVRPMGMFLFQRPGVKFDARTKISVDARLTDSRDLGLSESFGPTQVGHYRREDYARLQKTITETREIQGHTVTEAKNDESHTRNKVWYRNSRFEDITYGDGSYGSGTGKATTPEENAGYRALYSLQMCNNEHTMKALIDPIFHLGYDTETEVTESPEFTKAIRNREWNLIYDRGLDETITKQNTSGEYDISTVDVTREQKYPRTVPAVNPIMKTKGDAMIMDESQHKYTNKNPETGEITIETIDG